MNKLSDELIAFVREYERKCVESYLKNKKLIKVEIDKILNETIMLDADMIIKKETLLKIIQDKKINTPFSKYKLADILTFFVDLEPENIQSYSNTDNIENSYSNFFKILNIPDEIYIPQSIFIFHNVNTIYFIYQEFEVANKKNTTFKSILKPINREPLTSYQKSTKKVKIFTSADKKNQKKLLKKTRKHIH
jgi:hypothetical protein